MGGEVCGQVDIMLIRQYGNKDVIARYVQNQGREKEYKRIHEDQLELFDF